MRIFIILNPCAGAGRSRDIWPKIESFLQASGVDFTTRITTGPGDADRLAAESELSTFDALVAAGGDGTLFEVVNGLYRRNPGERPPLGVIPIGTGNAFARDLGLAPGDWRAAVERLLSAPVRRIDVGRVSSGLECFYFVNIIGLGFPVDAAVTARKLKWLGRGAYTLATLWRVLRLRSHPLCMELDGRRIEGNKVFVEISNTRYTGTHFLIAPAARMDDGLLDVVLLSHLSRRRILRLFPTIYSGRHVGFEEVQTMRAEKIRLLKPRGMPLAVDGEFRGETPVTIECLERDLSLRG